MDTVKDFLPPLKSCYKGICFGGAPWMAAKRLNLCTAKRPQGSFKHAKDEQGSSARPINFNSAEGKN